MGCNGTRSNGPLSTARGHRYLLVVTDLFSRWIEAFPITNGEANTIAVLLEQQVFMRWGYPRAALTDCAPAFQSTMWAKWCTKWNVKHFTTPIYHPQANPTERRNQEIKKGLRLALLNQDHRTWDQYISPIIFNLRRRLNRITGQTPSYVLLGRTLPRPGEHESYDVHSQSRFEEVRKSQARNAPVIRTESDKY